MEKEKRSLDQRLIDLKYELAITEMKIEVLELDFEAIKQKQYFESLINLRIFGEKQNAKESYQDQKVIIREANEINYNFLFQEFFSQGFNEVKILKL